MTKLEDISMIKEAMELMRSDLKVKLASESEYKTLNTPESFNVSANSAFDLRVKIVTDYCCSYIKA